MHAPRSVRMSAFVTDSAGLATLEYIIGAAVILGTLVLGVTSWNNGLVRRLQDLVVQMQAVR